MESNNNSNNNNSPGSKGESSCEPPHSSASSSSSSSTSRPASSYVNSASSSAKQNSLTRPPASATNVIANGGEDDVTKRPSTNDIRWQLLDKYRKLGKQLPSESAAAPQQIAISSCTHNPIRSRRCYPRHLPPSQDFPLPAGRRSKDHLTVASPHFSVMSMSLFGEQEILSSSSPLVVSPSPKLSKFSVATSSCSPNMYKSAVTFKKFDVENNDGKGKTISNGHSSAISNNNNDSGRPSAGMTFHQLSPPAVLNNGRPASSYDSMKDDDDDMDGSLLVEQVILRRTRPSKLVLQSDGFGSGGANKNYENFISNARKNYDQQLTRSPVLRLFRQPELRLRNSFSGRQTNSTSGPPPLLNDLPARPRQSFQPTAAFKSSFNNNNKSVMATVESTTEIMINSGLLTNLNSNNDADLNVGALENSEIVEFSPEQKDGHLAVPMSTFLSNNEQRPNTADGVVRQLVRRPRTFAVADSQTSPLVIRYPQQQQPAPKSPFDSEKLPRSPVCNSAENSFPENGNNSEQQPRQRVFPRTNPAFSRRNRQTTLVGAGGREFSPAISPTSTNSGEPVELLPGGIVYESSSHLQQQQRSQTLDSRYRNQNHQAIQTSGTNGMVLASPSRVPRSNNGEIVTNQRQFFMPNLPTITDPQPPYSQPLERKFSYDPNSVPQVALSPLPFGENVVIVSSSIQQQQQQLNPADLTPRGGLNGGDLTPTMLLGNGNGTEGSSQRSLNKDSLDSGYLPSDSQNHPSVSSNGGQMFSRQSNSTGTDSFRRPSTSSSSSEPLSSSLERSPSPVRQQQRQQQRQAARRRPAPPRRRHGNPPSTIFEPPASDASSDISDCARNPNPANNPLALQGMATSVAYHEGSMSDPDTLVHMAASLSRGGGSNTGSYVGPHTSHLLRTNGMTSSTAQPPSLEDQGNYSPLDDPAPGRPLSMLISQSEVSVGTAAHHHLIMSGLATGGNHRRYNQPSSSSALLMQHQNSLLSSAGGSLRLTPLQLLRKAGAAGTLPGSVGCAHGIALAAALQMYARTRKPLFSDADIELYAQQFMATHRRGLFGRKLSISEMLCWTKDLIQKPMLRTTCDKAARRLCVDTFRLIQQYMGDRRTSTPSLAIAAEVVTRGWLHPNLRDEIYMQLCRQTTETPVQESLERGWELMATCLNFFPPSLHFYGYIESYVYRHTDQNYDTPKVPVSHYASYCLRQLERVVESGAKKGVKRPTIDEIDQARSSVFQPSMFGATLDDIMLVQAARFPSRRLPWIQTTLSEAVLRLNGAQTEGIFRIPGDIDEVNALKARVNQWLPPDNIRDPHVPASLLKLWYRELWTPVITPDLYAACLAAGENAEEAIQIFAALPEINRLVLAYLIRFLQVFAAPSNAAVTKMDVSNLAMVFAPNVLRCSSDDPRVIFESTRREMTFLRTLILHLDTNFVEGVV